MRHSKILKRVILVAALVSAALVVVSTILLLQVPHAQVQMDGDKESKTALPLPDTMMLVFDTADLQNRLKTVAILSGTACIGLVIALRRLSKTD